MFYLKHKGTKLRIHDDNVYTICGLCGREHKVDLVDILSTGEADLYSTSVYCSACSGKCLTRQKEAAHG